MSQQEIKQLAGAMNLDDPDDVLGKAFYRDARNILFKGTPPNRRAELILGNLVKTSALLPASGTNKTILAKYDPIAKCIYYMNFNSNGFHGIYRFNTIGETFQRLVEVGVNTSGDPLGFTANLLYNIDIIYGDSVQGDILFWIDSLGRPSKINVNRALTGGYGSIQRSFLNVAKEPADIPPWVVYEDDAANTVNNLRKKLFKFKIRWVFDDNDKSVTSSQSEVPLPYQPFNQTIDSDPTKNCRIAVVYQTGAANVKRIEILAASSLGVVFSDYFLIASIDKAAQNIASNDTNTFLFYNNQGYDNIDVPESIQLFDYVPQSAFAQTTLNGNVLAYGNINEGYANLTNFSNGTNTSSMSSDNVAESVGRYFSLLTATQFGTRAFSTGSIHIIVRGNVFSGNVYTITMTDSTTITYTASVGDDTAAVIEGLRVDAISKGYTILLNTSNDLYVSKSNISLAFFNLTQSTAANLLLESLMAYDWFSKNAFGWVYFDAIGRTDGVVFPSGFGLSTQAYSEADSPCDITRFSASIYHRPPDWAYYYQWVRTKDLSKSKIQQWISDRTFKDASAVTGIVKYAYISIESLNAFVAANPGSPLGYDFAAGDRIRFIKRFNSDGSTANIYSGKDFEVTGVVVNPTINGEVKTGQFVKLVLPSTDGSFDFGDAFPNYFIELYTPAQSVANGLNVYYEFGEMYKIGNPTLATRFHQGMLQNQSTDLTTPATFQFTKGDYYIRSRAVQTGNVFTFNIPAATITGASNILMGINFVSQTYSDSNITTQNQSYVGQPVFNPFTDGRWFLAANLVTTFHIKGQITISFSSDQVGSSWKIVLINRFGENRVLVPSTNVATAGTYSFTVDTFTTLEDDHVFLFAQGNAARTINFISSDLTFTIDHVITQVMIDQNFSDYFQSEVNSNGRAFSFDPNANNVTFPTLYRWGLAYQSDTNINQSNRFFPQNFDNVDRVWGGIMAMKVWNRLLTFFQERKCAQTGVFQKYITDSDGNGQLITTDSIITSNNVVYYDGNFGVGNQATSIVQSGFVYYFIDPIKCKILRLSRDGITDLTELYKVQQWATQKFPTYLNPGTYTFGGNQKIIGVFNIRPDNVDEWIILVQGTSLSSGEAIAFEEAYNSFYSKIDIDCDALISAETSLFYFKNGVLWKQSGATYNSFFGNSVTGEIDLVFNENIAVKKVFDAIGYTSNDTWVSDTQGDIETNAINSQTGLTQKSLIMTQDYDVFEAPKRYAAFNFDMNSNANPITGLWEGDQLIGELIKVKLKFNGNAFTYLYAPFITYQQDNRNP